MAQPPKPRRETSRCPETDGFNDPKAPMKRLLLAGILASTIAPSLADAIDASTPCSVAIQVFDSEKRAGEVLAGAPSPHVLEVGDYIMSMMEQLDRQVGSLVGLLGRRKARDCGKRGSELSTPSEPDDPRGGRRCLS